MRIVANVAAVAGRGGRRASVIAVGALTIASCSGSGGADPAPPELSAEPLTSTSAGEDVTDSVAPTTSSGPTSTQEPAAPSTDASPSATTEPTTAPTEPPAPTMTTLEDLRAEIEADLNEAEGALFGAFADPSNPEARRVLGDYFGGGAYDGFLGRLDDLVASGRLARQADDLPSSTTVYEVMSSDGTKATISRCRIDAGVVYELDSAGREIIVDDSVIKFVTLSEVELVNGIWRLNGGTPVSQEAEVRTCDG